MGSGKDRRSGSAGLKLHSEGKCPCKANPGSIVRIDFHGEGGRRTRPQDHITFCPALAYDPTLTTQIYRVIEIDDDGGPVEATGLRRGLLWTHAVGCYREVLRAQARLVAWRDSLRAKAMESK